MVFLFHNRIINCAFLTISLLVTQALSTTISLSSSFEATLGDMINIDIMLSELDDNEDLGGFSLDLLYDPTILQFNDFSLSDNLGSLTAGDAFDFGSGLISPGKLSLSILSLLEPEEFAFQSNDFKLGTVTFNTLSFGTSLLSLDNVFLINSYGNELTFTAVNGSASVPEASTLSLLGSGLIAFLSTSLYRKQVWKA